MGFLCVGDLPFSIQKMNCFVCSFWVISVLPYNNRNDSNATKTFNGPALCFLSAFYCAAGTLLST